MNKIFPSSSSPSSDSLDGLTIHIPDNRGEIAFSSFFPTMIPDGILNEDRVEKYRDENIHSKYTNLLVSMISNANEIYRSIKD